MQTYSTKDFLLVSFLVASGCDMKSHSRSKGVTTFQFEQTNELQLLIDSFYAYKATVNPLAFGNAMRTIKTLLNGDSNEYELTQKTHLATHR